MCLLTCYLIYPYNILLWKTSFSQSLMIFPSVNSVKILTFILLDAARNSMGGQSRWPSGGSTFMCFSFDVQGGVFYSSFLGSLTTLFQGSGYRLPIIFIFTKLLSNLISTCGLWLPFIFKWPYNLYLHKDALIWTLASHAQKHLLYLLDI